MNYIYYFCRVVVVCAVAGLIACGGGGNGSNGASSPTPTPTPTPIPSPTPTPTPTTTLSVQSFGPANTIPFAMLTIKGTGFDPTAAPLVIFSEAGEPSLQVPPVAVTATSMIVSVPPFVDSSTGAFAAGTFSVSVSQTTLLGRITSNTVIGLQVQSLTSLPSSPGTLTVAYLRALRNFMANTLEPGVQGKLFDTPQMNAGMVNEVSALDTIIPGVESVFLDPSQTYTIGTFAGKNVTITTSDLARVDQLLLGMLTAQANATFTSATTRITGLASTAAATVPACQSAEAATAANDYSSNANPSPGDIDAYMAALEKSQACALAPAIQTASSLVLGTGAVAVGAMVLFLPAEVGTAAIALPTAALVYVAVAMAGGQIEIGGALGQASSAGIQLLQSGVQQLENFYKALLIKGVSLGILSQLGVDNPEKFIGLASAVFGAHSVIEAFFSGPPFNGGGTPATTFNLTVATTSTGGGAGTVSSFPGTILCGHGMTFCGSIYPAGATVFLNPSAAPGSTFSGWSGDCAAFGTGSCSLIMNSNLTATANFAQVAQVFTGDFQQIGQVNNTLDDCQFSLNIGSSIMLQITQSNGAVSGPAQLNGNWSASVTGGTNCVPSSGIIDITTNVSGTPSNLTFSSTFPGAPNGGAFTVQFTGAQGVSAVVGTATFTVANTTGSISQKVTLNLQQ